MGIGIGTGTRRFGMAFVIAVALGASVDTATSASSIPPNFAAPVDYTIGTQPDGFVPNAAPNNVVTADFNGDGKLDMAVAHTIDSSIYFLAGNGDGTFKPAVKIAVGVAIGGTMLVGDFNGDGKLDIFVSGVAGDTGHPIILLGNGDGTFKVSIDAGSTFNVAGTYPRGWAVGDFNGDGKLDLVSTLPSTVTADRGGYVVLLGNGDGTFTRGAVDTSGSLHYSRWVAVGDFDGDGKLDLAFGDGTGVDDTGTQELTIMLGNGDGTFRLSAHYHSPGPTAADAFHPEHVIVADLNRDGKLDVIVCDYAANIDVFINNGNGTFKPAVFYVTGGPPLNAEGYPRSVCIADMNGDGNVDLVVNNLGIGPGGADFTKFGAQPGSVAVLLGNGDSTFQAPIQYTPFYYPGCTVVADFNGDGLPDVAVTGVSKDHAVAVMLNQVYKPPSITTPPANQSVSAGLTATFSVVAGGTGPLTYQWQKNGADIGGATSASYITPATTMADNGSNFRVVVTNAAGSATSTNALLTVTAIPPTITTPPANQTVFAAQTATFTVAVSGTGPFTYQWQKNTINITGATSASYATAATILADSGSIYRVVVTNSVGTVTSAGATLTVRPLPPPPTVDSPLTVPANVVVNVPATFLISASDPGKGAVSYAWNFGDGATDNSGGSVTHTYTTPGSYTLTVTMTTTGGGTLTVSVPITVSAAPAGGGGAGGGATGAPIPMTVSKMQGSVNFKTSNHDGCSVTGIIPNVAAGFDPNGVVISFDFSGAIVPFTLDKKGSATNEHGSLRLKYKLKRNKITKKNEFLGGSVAFTVKLTNGAWSAIWATPTGNTKNTPLPVVINLTINGTTYTASATALYSSKAGIGGKFKGATK